MKNSRNTSWNRVSTWYNKEVGQKGHFFHQSVIIPQIVSFINEYKVTSVLDLACGQGVLERNLPQNIAYTGVDIAPDLISQAKTHTKRKNVQFHTSDVSKPIPALSGKLYDTVTCVLALQNIENYAGFFTVAASHIKTNGILVLVLNHPYYRIPRFSGWDIEAGNGRQRRWVSNYLSEEKIPIDMHPGEKQSSKTWSFHVPLSHYVDEMKKHSLAIVSLKELDSPKQSAGRHAKRENTARSEIPLFMLIVAQKIN